jgi:hypothetical protein
MLNILKPEGKATEKARDREREGAKSKIKWQVEKQEKWETLTLWEKKSLSLLKGSQALLTFPSDKGSVTDRAAHWLELA